ncbi:PQQ-dependent catabolism-associated CXXCW motif protein [uncultured Roseovarius sp.]|uniref:PQQ-dependent catabolism-associated CXXCW motif protein n=1 Tax=uncultured Roseovarius sp. TaxID=293344 RepID=UPI000C8C5124|nr:rhodanese [Roseovarius sp.]|tara:strand:- start:1368 stop:1916 length:549 start_codon:yes stop_codon:yes gene_type:complete
MIRAALAVLMLLTGPVAAQGVAEPEGYRGEPYRAPVPKTLAGAVVVDAGAAHDLWQGGEVAFVDVLPRPPKPANLPAGTIWRDKLRLSIPGAVWLPNTGYERIAPETEAYLREGLTEVTGGDPDHPVLFFCLEDCWMSWNAAKRALEMGYSEVYWFPEGTDGWDFEGYPLERVQARPGEPGT